MDKYNIVTADNERSWQRSVCKTVLCTDEIVWDLLWIVLEDQ